MRGFNHGWTRINTDFLAAKERKEHKKILNIRLRQGYGVTEKENREHRGQTQQVAIKSGHPVTMRMSRRMRMIFLPMEGECQIPKLDKVLLMLLTAWTSLGWDCSKPAMEERRSSVDFFKEAWA
jgi:hypothetical protein